MQPTMQPEMKFMISQDNKVLHSVCKEIDHNDFYKNIEAIQQLTNATLTKMIEDAGDSGVCIEEDEDDSETDDAVCTNPKKKRNI